MCVHRYRKVYITVSEKYDCLTKNQGDIKQAINRSRGIKLFQMIEFDAIINL